MTEEQTAKFNMVLMIVGACLPILSLIASLVNAKIRSMTEAGEKVSPVLATIGSILNFLSINLDKAIQQVKLAKGTAVPPALPGADPGEPGDASHASDRPPGGVMEMALVAGVAVLGTLAIALVGYLLMGPKEHAAGVAEAEALARAKAEGLKVGADVAKAQLEAAAAAVDARAEHLKARDPVDVANDIIEARRKKS